MEITLFCYPLVWDMIKKILPNCCIDNEQGKSFLGYKVELIESLTRGYPQDGK